ncbi:uncharacterized protein LOC123265979 [Cotesia glomerata]|uniref:uncharacterized protein LOC123265979 n=1 Tax=Cotesia glomerata TaxID=32391 RepID=UPI001D022A0A|nr:uncharacterized protein LOC123265979 [Cotesia glomerata]XP_044585938.1 uncharacterized protein LOC123265979 [Cotesia glomerata]XP_044585946.1 uncharacterized protein LOC123265979 [Cotesia glomerata]
MDGKENPKDDSPLDHNDTCLYTYSNNHNYNYKHQHQKSKSFVTSNPRVTQNDNADADKDQYKLYSSSDENIQKTCNSNISTIDTQSINNILDGYEDLDCEKSSDSSSLNARNFKLETDIDIGTGINQHLDPHQEHLLQQKHQQLDKIFITAGKMRHRPTCCSSERLDKKQVLRVNQQTQVRQRPRDPVKEHQQQHQHHISLDAHKVSPFAGDGDLNSLIARSNTNIYENKKIPGRQVMYLQKGEVQKRVDEWLNHSQNLQLNKSNASCSGGSSNKLINSSNKREIYLTRSNSNIEQKRRYCNNESRLLNDKMESRLNDTVSFENLNSEQQLPRREYKAILSNDRINSQKETYRDYSAVRNGLRNHRLHHQDTDNLKVYKINQTDGVSESSGDYFYPHPQLKQQRMSTYHQDIKVTCEKKGYFEEDKEIYSKSKLVSNGIRRVPSASRRPIRCADDPPSKNKARESRRQLITAPVNQHVSNSESVNETTVEKEPINHQTVNKELNKVKKPPPPPRRDFNDRNNREETFKHTLFNNQSGCSSFKPLGKLLTKQLGDCNANDDFDITIGRVHDIRLVTRNTDHDNDQIINNNSSLHCKTVNSDDLLSILTPAAKKSVYKEDYQEEPDRGFANFTKEVHQNSNSSEFTNVGAKSFKRRDNYYCKDNTCREHSVDTENDKVLSTFNKYNKDRLKEVIDEEKSSADKIEIVEKNLTSRSRSSSTNKVTDKILQESYEDRSTLKLDRDRGAIHTKDLESRGTLVADFAENSIFQHKNDDCFQSHLLNAKKSLKVEPIYSKANSDSIHGELFKVKHKTMINNDSSCTPTINSDVYNNLSLLKSSVDNSKGNNDSFERLFNEETNQVKRFNFNSVLSDDYKNLHIREANRLNECKVYNTKEMKERQRLMDMLRKRDYHAVKLELEKSFAVSTPGDSSPVCYPPCSPPPAPAAYLSSVRASSRKLDGASGHPSPDRDSVGRLLRYLKSFYKEIATRDPHHLPPWTSFLPAGTFCPAHFQPHLQLIYNNDQEYRLERIKIDQIFSSVRLSDGILLEGPRRVAIEGGPGSGRTSLCLKLLHQWANQGDGPALAFMIPLRELRGNSIINYLTREFLPKSAALGDAIAQVWRTLHLLEDRVLFILDGYDECSGAKASLADAADLLEARLFPDARILVTCTPNNSSSLSTMVQRRILLTGLEWSHVEKLCVAYFIHNNLSEHACDFLENLNVQSQSAKEFIQYPLGWIMLCSLYRDAGKLPSECNTLIQEAIKGVVKKSLEDPLTPDEEIPIYYKKKLEDFGKLSLSSLRKGKCCYTETELRTRGGGIDITRLGFLTRGFTFGHRRKTEIYTPIHLAVIQYFAACYLASVSQFTNILRNELDGLPTEIISHLAALLGPRTHLILNQLCPLEIPPRMIFSLLKAAGTSDNNILSVCRLFGAASGFGPTPNEKPPVPLVQISPLELEGWTKILSSSACTLEALEVVFQVERGSDPTYLNNFFNALSNNESVKLVRITSLLGQEFSTDETQRLAEYLKSVLSKKKLNDFELVITCLEESSNDRLECVVCALCQGLRNASPHLSRVVLDMNLSSEQVSRVCKTLRDCSQVQALHLPHLSCGSDGLASVANLLKERPLFALNLAGSWGTKTEDPSSSGISMGSGSGSGSSGCASNTLGALSVNRCYSSLPRGTLAAYGSLTRPATLPRLPLGIGLNPSPATANGTLPQNDNDKDSSSGNSKRNSDSVLCHRLPVMHPLPTCDVACHQGTGFHEIFSTIREQNCKLRSLNVSKCLQGSLDASCLGETIRRARNLDAVRAAGASRPIDIMPLVLALTEAPCLQLLDLASPRLAIDDHPSRLLCHALARNETLRLLSLEGWTFRIEESDSLAVFAELLMCTSVRELNLCNARLHLAVHEGPLSRLGRRDDVGAELLRAAPPPTCPSIVFLRLAGFQVSVNDRLVLRGPLLLPFIAGFTALSDLDLSLDKSEIGNNNGSQLYIDDKILQQFFSCLGMNLKNLQTLRINYWQITLENSEKTMKHISKNLRLCNLSFLKANGLVVTDSVKRIQIEHVFIQTVLANLQALTWLCLDGIKLTENQCTTLGKWIKDKYPGNLLEISAKDINVKAVKAFVAAVEDGERIDINYTGGFICRLKISKLQKNSKNKSKFK